MNTKLRLPSEDDWFALHERSLQSPIINAQEVYEMLMPEGVSNFVSDDLALIGEPLHLPHDRITVTWRCNNQYTVLINFSNARTIDPDGTEYGLAPMSGYTPDNRPYVSGAFKVFFDNSREINFFDPGRSRWVNEEIYSAKYEYMQYIYAIAAYTLKLMTCKNITYEDYDPMKNLTRHERRAREREKKGPLLQYKILHINPMAKKAITRQPKKESTRSVRVHSVRGHFKTFTEEHPAFGKPWGVGTFWTGPFVCGNPEYGLTWKDYHIELEGKPHEQRN